MNAQILIDTASALVAGDKGLLTSDETIREQKKDGTPLKQALLHRARSNRAARRGEYQAAEDVHDASSRE